MPIGEAASFEIRHPSSCQALTKLIEQARLAASRFRHNANDLSLPAFILPEAAVPPEQPQPPSPSSSPPRAAPAAPAARHPTPARRASRRRPAACADCARLARLGEPPVAPAGVPGEKWLYISYTLTIRPINFPFPEFQAARRVKHLTLAVAGYPFVTLTGMSADAGFPRQRHA